MNFLQKNVSSRCSNASVIDNQLIDEGMVGYYFYSDETSDNRRGEAELVIILVRLNKSNNRPFPSRLADLSATLPPPPPPPPEKKIHAKIS